MKGFFPPSFLHQGQPSSLVPRCGACGLFRTCESPKMKVSGRGEREVLVVGEAPGETEDAQGKPFVGKAGQFLREKLREGGFDLERDAWITNAIICRPPKNRTPDPKQVACCRPNLTRTLQRLRPRVVVPLGKTALSSVLADLWKDLSGLERWVGWRMPHEQYWICPTYHPSYLLRMNNPALERLFVQHLTAAFGISHKPPVQPDWRSKIHIELEDVAAARELRRIRKSSRWAAVDYETNCIKPEWPRSRIFSCAVSDGETTVSYPWVGEAIAETERLLLSPRVHKIASNLKMEERWTQHTFGHGVVNWGWDTMLASHCLDNRTGICSLKFQSLVRLGVPAYNRHVEPFLMNLRGPYNRIQEIEPRQLLLYGGMDALLEYRLAQIQRKDLGYVPV